MKTRTLTLRREALAQLDAHDLTGVVGAAGGAAVSGGQPIAMCVYSIALKTQCGTSVNPKCPGADG